MSQGTTKMPACRAHIFHFKRVSVHAPVLDLSHPRKLVFRGLNRTITSVRLSNLDHSLCAHMGVTSVIADALHESYLMLRHCPSPIVDELFVPSCCFALMKLKGREYFGERFLRRGTLHGRVHEWGLSSIGSSESRNRSVFKPRAWHPLQLRRPVRSLNQT